MSDKIKQFPNSPVSPDLLLHQLLENVDKIEDIVVGVKTTEEDFIAFHSTSKIADLSMIIHTITVYFSKLISGKIN